MARSNTSKNLRVDRSTRLAIDEIQNLLFDPDASGQVFELVLGFLHSFTKSDYSVSYVSADDPNAPILPNVKLSALCSKNQPSFINAKVLESWVGQKSILTSPVYYNDPIAPASKRLILPDVEVSSLMILPIIVHAELRAVCILAKKQGAYEAEFIHKIKPLLGSVMCAIQSAESVNGNFLGLDKTIGTNRFLSSLISSSPIGIVVVNANNQIILSNPNAQEILNKSGTFNSNEKISPMIGRDIKHFFPKYDALFQWSSQEPKFDSPLKETLPRMWQDQHLVRFDGRNCTVNLTVFRYVYGGERFTTLQLHDVTAIHHDADKHKRALQQLNALTQLLPVAIIQVTKDWHCKFANDKWFEFTGMTEDESKDRDWINAIHPSDVNELLDSLHSSLLAGRDLQREVRIVTPLGSTKWIDFNSRVLIDDNGIVDGFLGTFADVTERYLSQQKLKYVAEYDGLTGLANKILFQDRLSQAFIASARDQSVVSLFFLDLDGFKDVNDTLGHDVGDILLQKVSERLLDTLRRNDTVARFGGDEFVILLGNSETLTEVLVVAEKVVNTVARSYVIEDHEVYITTSLGISRGTHQNSNARVLLKNADMALYNAKKEGKNKYQLFDDELAVGSQLRIEMLNQLRTAEKQKRYVMHYQAIGDLNSNKIVGFESLIRFNNNKNELVDPDSFISILEETGMIMAVGRWVIEETCRQLGVWIKESVFPNDAYLAFNVSSKQLLEDGFVSNLRECCARHQINPNNLVMEITESVIINKPQNVKCILNEIRALGIRIALDDFGTGYSSLSYLQNYPFDILKIDKSFIDDLSENSNDTKITKAIIALASSLELRICAEGVETAEAFDVVRKLGAQVYQGYYLSKALPAEQVLDFLLD